MRSANRSKIIFLLVSVLVLMSCEKPSSVRKIAGAPIQNLNCYPVARANIDALIENTKTIPQPIFNAIVRESANCMGSVELQIYLDKLDEQKHYVQAAVKKNANLHNKKSIRAVAGDSNSEYVRNAELMAGWRAKHENQMARRGDIVSVLKEAYPEAIVNSYIALGVKGLGAFAGGDPTSRIIGKGASWLASKAFEHAVNDKFEIVRSAAAHTPNFSNLTSEQQETALIAAGNSLAYLAKTNPAGAVAEAKKVFGLSDADTRFLSEHKDELMTLAIGLSNGNLPEYLVGNQTESTQISVIGGINNLNKQSLDLHASLDVIAMSQSELIKSIKNLEFQMTSQNENFEKETVEIKNFLFFSNLNLEQKDQFLKDHPTAFSPGVLPLLQDIIQKQMAYQADVRAAEDLGKWGVGLSGAGQSFYIMGNKTMGDIMTGGALVSNLASNLMMGGWTTGGIGAGFAVFNFGLSLMNPQGDATQAMIGELQEILKNEYRIMAQIENLSYNMQVDFSEVSDRLDTITKLVHQAGKDSEFAAFKSDLDACMAVKNDFKSFGKSDGAAEQDPNEMYLSMPFSYYVGMANKESQDNLRTCGSYISKLLNESSNPDGSFTVLTHSFHNSNLETSVFDEISYAINPMQKYLKAVVYKDTGIERETILGAAATGSHTFQDFQNKLSSLNDGKIRARYKMIGSNRTLNSTFLSDTALKDANDFMIEPQILVSFVDLYKLYLPLNHIVLASLAVNRDANYPEYFSHVPEYLNNIDDNQFPMTRFTQFLDLINTSIIQQNLINGEFVLDSLNRVWGNFDRGENNFDHLPEMFSDANFAKMMEANAEQTVDPKKLALQVLLSNPRLIENLVRYRIYSIANMAAFSNDKKNYTLGAEHIKSAVYRAAYKSGDQAYMRELLQPLNQIIDYDKESKKWFFTFVMTKLNPKQMDAIQTDRAGLVKAMGRYDLHARLVDQTTDQKDIGSRPLQTGYLEIRVPLPTPDDFAKKEFLINPIVDMLSAVRDDVLTDYVSYKTYFNQKDTAAKKEINWFKIQELL